MMALDPRAVEVGRRIAALAFDRAQRPKCARNVELHLTESKLAVLCGLAAQAMTEVLAPTSERVAKEDPHARDV